MYFPVTDNELTFRTVLFEKFEPFFDDGDSFIFIAKISCEINNVKIFSSPNGAKIENNAIDRTYAGEPGLKEKLFYNVPTTLLKTDSDIISVIVKRIHYFNGES